MRALTKNVADPFSRKNRVNDGFRPQRPNDSLKKVPRGISGGKRMTRKMVESYWAGKSRGSMDKKATLRAGQGHVYDEQRQIRGSGLSTDQTSKLLKIGYF